MKFTREVTLIRCDYCSRGEFALEDGAPQEWIKWEVSIDVCYSEESSSRASNCHRHKCPDCVERNNNILDIQMGVPISLKDIL